MANILVIEDEPILARNIRDSLVRAGHTAVAVGSGEEGVKSARADVLELILTDLRLPGIDGLSVLRQLRQEGSTAPVIVMTAHGDIAIAVEAMKAGAADFLTKPLDLENLKLTVERALQHQRVADELRYYKERERAETNWHQLIGESGPMRTVKAVIGRIAATPALSAEDPPSVLITGETGTGKGLIARAIHDAGPRHGGKFVHVTCTAVPDHLAESEFFGHVKGAFTDARTDKKGLFELADQGTMFLDEIGHMPLALQAKLLGVFEHRAIRPVGGTRERKVNVHVIAATNRDLPAAIEAKEFREDLYHRLRVLSIQLPPLRDRGDDVETLANYFLRKSAQRFGLSLVGFSREALEVIQAYDWPGNVRELMHTMESAVLFADGPVVEAAHINIKMPDASGSLRVELASTNNTLTLDFSGDCPKLDEIENQVILAALEHSQHNLSRAARILGISRDAIRYRLEKFTKRDGQASDGE